MTWPIFLQTNLIGDFFSFSRKSAHHTIYVGMQGDIYVKRESILLSLGSVKHTPFKEIVTGNVAVYASKYYPIDL
jgi:hypothetical protein